MLRKTLSILAVAAVTGTAQLPFDAQAQDVLPQDIVNQLQLACSADNDTDADNAAAVDDDNNDNVASTCANTGATLAAANPALAAEIAALATRLGPDGTGSLLAQLLATALPDQIPEIISRIVAEDTENAAEILLSAAGTFPEDDQETILTQIVAQLQSDNPNLLDDTALAALGLPINPAFQSAGVGLQGLDLVSPD